VTVNVSSVLIFDRLTVVHTFSHFIWYFI